MQAHIRALEVQLQAAQAANLRPASDTLHSPPSSPPQPGHASPAASSSGTAEGQALEAEDSEQSVAGPAGSNAGTPAQPSSSPQPNKENANLGGNGRQGDGTSGGGGGFGGSNRGQQAKAPPKGQWDAERSELLTLLERLQDQLSTHAEQQQQAAATAATPGHAAGGRNSMPRRKAAADGGCAPPPSPFCQPLHGEAGGAEQRSAACTSPKHTAAFTPQSHHGGSEDGSCQPAGGQRAGGAASNLQASFESVSGGSSGVSEPTASPCHSPGYTAEGGSPAVNAHHHIAADSPTTQRSARRSSAPSPPSVRQQWAPAPASPAGEHTPSSATPAAEGVAPVSSQAQFFPAEQQPQKPQPRCKTPGGSGHTMEAFLGASPGSSAPLPSSTPSAEQAERLQQAEQRAADLEVRPGGVSGEVSGAETSGINAASPPLALQCLMRLCGPDKKACCFSVACSA